MTEYVSRIENMQEFGNSDKTKFSGKLSSLLHAFSWDISFCPVVLFVVNLVNLEERLHWRVEAVIAANQLLNTHGFGMGCKTVILLAM